MEHATQTTEATNAPSGSVDNTLDALMNCNAEVDTTASWLRREYARLMQRECIVAKQESNCKTVQASKQGAKN